MGDFVFTVAKGRGVELWRRVEVMDPPSSGLVIVLLASLGLETDVTLRGYTTLAALLAGTSQEATNTGYARKVLTSADLPPFPAPDVPGDQYLLPLPNQTWASIANDGTGTIGKLLVCYDPDIVAGTDAEVIPLSGHDFVVLVNGDEVVTDVNTDGFYRAAADCPGAP